MRISSIRPTVLPLAAAAWFGLPGLGWATVYTLDATLQGWYNSYGTATSASPYSTRLDNYIAGNSAGYVYRDFFVFNLGQLPQGTITSATLSLYNPSKATTGVGDGFSSPNANESFALGSVSTSLSTLQAGSGGVGVFNDFGAGTLWGTQSVSANDDGAFVRVGLNGAFDSAAQSRLGAGSIALAGHLVGDMSFTQNDFIFGFTGTSGSPVVQLSLDIAPVPEPSASLLAACGVAALWLGRSKARTCRPVDKRAC